MAYPQKEEQRNTGRTHFGKWIVVFVIGGVALAAETSLLLQQIPTDLLLKADKSKIIYSQNIRDIRCDENRTTCQDFGEIKSYLYVSDVEVPQAEIIFEGKIIKEDLSQRTRNAQFFKKETQNKRDYWIGKFYAGIPFYKEGNKWYQTETATTTIDAFEKQTASFWGKTTFADTATTTSNAGDGAVYYYSGATWAAAHDATVGDAVSYTATADDTICSGQWGGNYRIYRAFYPFDTSSLPDNAIITEATFSVVFDSVLDQDNDGNDYATVNQTSQASPTELVVADFDNVGSVEGTDARVDFGNIVTLQYTNFLLNAAGRGFISKTGWTLLGMREGHDILNDPYAGGDNTMNRANTRFSEYTGTNNDPTLVIIYSTALPIDDTRIIISDE